MGNRVQTGELERLKEFGITKAMIVEQGNKIMRGIELVNNKGQIIDQENFNKALFSLMQERFQGGMEIQANSFKGLWSTIKGVFSTTLATMAGISAEGEVQIGGFFDSLKQKMQFVIDKLNEWQQNGQLQEWADKAQKALARFWAVGERIFNGLVGVAGWIIDHWGMIEPILAGVLAGFLAYRTAQAVIATVTAAQAALNLVMAANPIGLVVLAMAGLVVAGVALYRNWDKISETGAKVWGAMAKNWDRIKTVVIETWSTITDTIKNAINGIIAMLNRFIRAFNSIKIKVPSVNIPLIGTVGGWSIGVPSIPEIPLLAQGGIINRPVLLTDLATGMPAGIAGEAGKEAITPIGGSGNEQSDRPIIINIYEAIDPEGFERKIRQLVIEGAF